MVVVIVVTMVVVIVSSVFCIVCVVSSWFSVMSIRVPATATSPVNSHLVVWFFLFGWLGAIWHRTQFGTKPNLAPDQFGTKSAKESIWHRTQFGTKSVKESIWHQECKRSQFGTGVNLAPDQFGTKSAKESIWHRSQFGTIQMEHILLLWTWYNRKIWWNK